jgi:hypothetical protein
MRCMGVGDTGCGGGAVTLWGELGEVGEVLSPRAVDAALVTVKEAVAECEKMRSASYSPLAQVLKYLACWYSSI